MKADKKLSPIKMFRERMVRAGREKEWLELTQKVMLEQGLTGAKATNEVMRRMGYEGPAKERERFEKYTRGFEEQLKENTKNLGKIAKEEQKKAETFEEAVAALPDKAPYGTEIDWIRAHPAMARIHRQTDKTKDVMVTVADILEQPHGTAPSKAAVFALQHWANHPMEFFKQILGEHKKHAEDLGAVGAVERDMGLDEVKALLKQVG